MTVLIENEYPAEKAEKIFDFDLQETAELVMETFLDEEQCPYEASVSITITDDGAIREINREHRGVDASTDVLSFPMVQYPAPADFSVLEEEGMESEAFDPDSGELMLGDVVLSADHIAAQAESYGHPVRREYAFLIVHSLLHLAGYDHMVPEEAEVMESRQRAILDKCGITR
ncbi:MAG: rRNA maturation RNase YbeY [Lachnospiraceae bacterium]|nr:rRNA maturation RNase YbeY [Lachnospiraceae bacterium]